MVDGPYRTPGHAPRSDEPSILDLLESVLESPVTVDCDGCRDMTIAGTVGIDGHHEMCPAIRERGGTSGR